MSLLLFSSTYEKNVGWQGTPCLSGAQDLSSISPDALNAFECIKLFILNSPRMLSSWWWAKKRLWSQCFWNSLFSAHFQLILCSTDGVFSYLFIWWKTLAFCSWLSWIFTQEAVQTRTSGPLFATFGYAVASGHPFISKMQVSNRKKKCPPHPPCEECLGVTFPVESQQ